MKKGIIRPLAICVFRHNDSILVAEGYDSVKDDYFYRPIGGGIEYGESSADAVVREVMEEIEADIYALNYLGTVENVFTFNGEVGHEIVMVYDASFADKSFYNLETFEGKEDDGSIFKLMWCPINDFQNGKLRLVPKNLLELVGVKA
ncbi:NUDIX hydrolase [Virgibacillus ihumii]|uniref:NUDIX hydrolase n=1 Tax=Virgibacillus ihumii TaxID=2686091 RepID=UPI00157BB734|nr:NUDIX hydrolase [Virgibacillus ihumii]